METGKRNWGSLAPELLTLVVQKVQEGARSRGEGRRVVALAGVCRNWRRSVQQEFHRQPPSLLTFPASIRQPAPCGPHIQCLLKKTGGKFRLVQVVSGDEYFLLGARQRCSIGSSYFRISADPRSLWKQKREDAGSVTSNFWRTAFTLHDNFCDKSAKLNSEPATLWLNYEEVAVDGNCLRRMRCRKLALAGGIRKGEGVWWLSALHKWNHLLNAINPVNQSYKLLKNCTPRSTDLVKKLRSSVLNESTFSLQNRDPHWHEQENCWSLDFKGRGSIVASVHNFQLVSSDEYSSDGRVVLQLGKLCKGLFLLDFRAPLTALEAFAVCLTSFATSVGLDI